MTIKYDKLIRDKIPEIIRKNNAHASTYVITDQEELKSRLIKKLHEEMNEYMESQDPEELADIMEVIKALAENIHNISYEQLEQVRNNKEQERGGFDKGLVLTEVQELDE